MSGPQPIGLAALHLSGHAAWNAFTGVDRAYRGKGVARALKVRTVEWARQNGVDYIYTGNDEGNKRMLAINVRLGYEPVAASIEVRKEL
jgi:GNAT superfamily N-acetyltransferase